MISLVREFRYLGWRDTLARKIAWRLPRRIAMWAAIRVMANATMGDYSTQIVPDLTAMDALRRWTR